MSILTASAPVVNFDFAEVAPESDDSRPTAGPDFIPTPEELAEAAAMLNGDDDFPERTDDEWEEMAEDAYAMDRVCSGPIF